MSDADAPARQKSGRPQKIRLPPALPLSPSTPTLIHSPIKHIARVLVADVDGRHRGARGSARRERRVSGRRSGRDQTDGRSTGDGRPLTVGAAGGAREAPHAGGAGVAGGGDDGGARGGRRGATMHWWRGGGVHGRGGTACVCGWVTRAGVRASPRGVCAGRGGGKREEQCGRNRNPPTTLACFRCCPSSRRRGAPLPPRQWPA